MGAAAPCETRQRGGVSPDMLRLKRCVTKVEAPYSGVGSFKAAHADFDDSRKPTAMPVEVSRKKLSLQTSSEAGAESRYFTLRAGLNARRVEIIPPRM
jgi:hypothetical protein